MVSTLGLKEDSREGWPAYPFAQAYIRRGADPSVLKYCKLVLDQELLSESFKLKSRLEGQDPYDRVFGVDKEADSYRTAVSRLEQERHALDRWRMEDAWTTPNVGTISHCDLQTLFPSIGHVLQKELMKKCEAYDDASPDPIKNDFCSWVSRIQPALSTTQPEQANYLLLSKVPASYTDKIIFLYNIALPKYPTRILARKLGAVVYKQQNKDPLVIASSLELGVHGCITPEQLYKRVVELHFCRADRPAPEAFLVDMFCGVAAKLGRRLRTRYYEKIFAKWPAFASLIDPQVDQYMAACHMESLAVEVEPLPTSASAIEEFSRVLVMFALAPDFSRVEESRSRLFKDPAHPVYGVMGPNPRLPPKKSASHSAPPSGAPLRTSEVHAVPVGAEAIENPLSVAAVAIVPDAIPHKKVSLKKGSRGAKKTPPKEPRLCSHCSSTTHNEDKCWKKHPEQRELSMKEWTAKRKGSKATGANKEELKVNTRSVGTLTVTQAVTQARGDFPLPGSAEGQPR